MTRKHYQMIADRIASAKRIAWANNVPFDDAAHLIVNELANALAQDNPRFDRCRFVNACLSQPL